MDTRSGEKVSAQIGKMGVITGLIPVISHCRMVKCSISRTMARPPLNLMLSLPAWMMANRS